MSSVSHKGGLLKDVLLALEQAGHRTCVLHGYRDYPERVNSDVDTITEDPARIPYILSRQKTATVVRARRYRINYSDYSFIIYKQYEGEGVFLTYDASADYFLLGLPLFKGEEFLETRRPFKFFAVPSARLEFCSYLIRKVFKGSLNHSQTRCLTELYEEDPAGCEEQLDRFFPEAAARLIRDSANSGDWQPVCSRLDHLRRELLKKFGRERPLRLLLHRWGLPASRLWRRIKSIVRPPGLMVVFLGVDGAGKSTVTPQVEKNLAPAFNHTKSHHKRSFGSALNWARQRRRGPHRPQAQPTPGEKGLFAHGPHIRPPRGFVASLAKLAFWYLNYGVLGYATDIYPSLVRHTLVLFDRYYHDLLVDAKRYRYGGPLWPVRLINRLIPRPHLVILLDAPPEVLYARKQEFDFAEVSRQREAYLDIVKSLPEGHIVDASRPLSEVVAQCEQIIIDYLAKRTARRFNY